MMKIVVIINQTKPTRCDFNLVSCRGCYRGEGKRCNGRERDGNGGGE